MRNALFYFLVVSFGLIGGDSDGTTDNEENIQALRNITEIQSEEYPTPTSSKPNLIQIQQDDLPVPNGDSNNNNPSLAVFPDEDVKEDLIVIKHKLLSALLKKFQPLNLLRPLAVKVANVVDYLSHPNVGWTPGYFFRKLRDKFENLLALSQGASGNYYPFPYRTENSNN